MEGHGTFCLYYETTKFLFGPSFLLDGSMQIIHSFVVEVFVALVSPFPYSVREMRKSFFIFVDGVEK